MTTFAYRKSSYSDKEHECVEVATNIPGTVAIRDSKHAARGHIRLTPTAWTAFLRGIRRG
ncbi:DUF397 domain-containing protein [Streptomyces sp. ODS28]|uniref:DUF397 domain-containing protein n=1 Tax=Streptomyces sp. ODS28 TaxID=3136688 RepID=UPI0031E58CBF